jgi:hypothetical protein
MIRRVEYNGLADCIEITNGDARLVIPVTIGPRVLFYGFDDGDNVFGWHPGAAVETELGTWKPYGGHRLWVAPENMPLSYAPDNEPVDHGTDGELSVRLMQPASEPAAFEKEMTVTMDVTGSGVTVDHRITNRGEHRAEISAWALSIMRSGGTVLIPNEPFAPYGPDALLPVRSMALWSYTDLTDPRWSFDKESIRLRVDESIRGPQKMGVSNKQGFVRYELPDVTFTKSAAWSSDSVYPDINSNFEVYTDGGFVEIESLSPLQYLEPGQSVLHQERWELTRSLRPLR